MAQTAYFPSFTRDFHMTDVLCAPTSQSKLFVLQPVASMRMDSGAIAPVSRITIDITIAVSRMDYEETFPLSRMDCINYPSKENKCGVIFSVN